MITSDYVMMPTEDYVAACDTIRKFSKKTDLIKSGDLSTEIEAISLELNIAYGETPPEDTTKLWVKTGGVKTVKIAGDTLTGDSLRPASVESVGSVGYTTSYPITAMVDGKVYLFGGGDATSGKLNTIRVYDPATKFTTLLSETLPMNLNGTGCGAVGKNIFIFGGNSGGTPQKTLYMFDTEEQKITDLSDLYTGHIGSTGLCKISCVTIGDIIYLFGGVQSSGVGTSAIYRFNGAEKRFMGSGVNVPYSCNQGYICSHVKDADGKDVIYVFAGGSYGSKYYIWKYYCNSQTVEQITEQSPETFFWVPACTIDGKVYIFCGGKKIYCFDPSTEKLTLMETTTNISSTYTSAVPFERGALIFGGSNSTVQNFRVAIDSMPLDNGHLKIVPAIGVNPCKLIDSGIVKLSIGVKEIYKGDENNEGQPVDACVYQYGEWRSI